MFLYSGSRVFTSRQGCQHVPSHHLRQCAQGGRIRKAWFHSKLVIRGVRSIFPAHGRQRGSVQQQNHRIAQVVKDVHETWKIITTQAPGRPGGRQHSTGLGSRAELRPASERSAAAPPRPARLSSPRDRLVVPFCARRPRAPETSPGRLLRKSGVKKRLALRAARAPGRARTGALPGSISPERCVLIGGTTRCGGYKQKQ